MAVNVVRYEFRGRIQWGVIREGRITPIPGDFPTTKAFIAGNSVSDLIRLRGDEVNVSDATILSPVTRNQQFLCQGANYRQHMIESGMDPDAKKFNMFFTKASSCIVPADPADQAAARSFSRLRGRAWPRHQARHHGQSRRDRRQPA